MSQEPRPSVAERIRALFDAPRFCRDCGEPIEVTDIPRFDERTGERHERWYWHCPKVYVSFGGGTLRAEQAGDHIHPYGPGRPGWHRRAAADAAASASKE